MASIGVMRHKFVVGWPDRPDKNKFAREEVRPTALREALTTAHPTDAHCVMYVVQGADQHHRILKSHVDDYLGIVECQVMMVDVDNPPQPDGSKRPWQTDDEIRAKHIEFLELNTLARAGWYFTNNGLRLVQPLIAPCTPDELERYLLRWHEQLADVGIEADPACKDWTRMYRLPWVRRDGKDVRPLLYLDRMEPVDLGPPPPRPPKASGSGPRRRRGPVVAPTEWKPYSPAIWHDRIEVIASAVRKEPSDWHLLFLAPRGRPPRPWRTRGARAVDRRRDLPRDRQRLEDRGPAPRGGDHHRAVGRRSALHRVLGAQATVAERSYRGGPGPRARAGGGAHRRAHPGDGARDPRRRACWAGPRDADGALRGGHLRRVCRVRARQDPPGARGRRRPYAHALLGGEPDGPVRAVGLQDGHRRRHPIASPNRGSTPSRARTWPRSASIARSR